MTADAYAEIQAELDSIVGDPSLSVGAKLTRLRTMGANLSTLQGRVSSYIGDQHLVQEASAGDHARRVLAMRGNADARAALIEQGHDPEELDKQGFVSHEQIDQLEQEGLLAEAAEQWPS